MIHSTALTKYYQSGANRIEAVRALDLSIEPGTRVAIVGRSGSGKSTLLNLLAGLDRPSTGTLTVNSMRLDKMSRVEMANYRLRTVGVIFQSFQLIPQRTALQNVELPMIMSGVPRSERRRLASQWLDRVGLGSRLDHLPYALSGGEQQRVAIARALVNAPRVVLADEPTGNLDSASASEVIRLLVELSEETEATFVLVTHELRLANECADRRFHMSDGALTEST